ncbi:HdeD family acid-resistance protein [Bosea sp. (in: a-proteobacteria)]|uniref:HdeD family acid-resistance protein n=1 Tax=Bosea sp. (in: a-proteobacteria) TaxID=1871050 RepID=UPI002FC9B3FA
MAKTSSQSAESPPAHGLVRAMSGKMIALGIALIICGAVAIASPAIATMAVTLFLGLVLAVGGIVKIVQSFLMKERGGFLWQLLVGTIELLGGLLVYFNPMKGAIAITIVIALVLMAEGLAQLGLALKMRSQRGVGWMFLSGIVTTVAGAALAMRLPYDGVYAPGTLVGISLLFAGWAYIAIALAARKTGA